MKKLTVTFPDGTKGSRRTPRPYTFVIASRLDKARPSRDRVKHRYEPCPEARALEADFDAKLKAARAGMSFTASTVKAWHDAFDATWRAHEPLRGAHRATCALAAKLGGRCDGSGNVSIEVSRSPEPTGWLPVSWHHSRTLADKALATSYTDWKTRGYDEVRIFPVDGNGG